MKKLIAARFPEVEVRAIEYLASGFDFDTFVTTDGWAFRFPRHSDGEARLDGERRVLDFVSPYVSSEVAVPVIELVGERTSAFPYRFGGHRYISGVAADGIELSRMLDFQRGLAAALSAVHSIPKERAHAFGIEQLDPGEDGRRRWFEEACRAASGFRGLDRVVDSALDWAGGISWPLPQFNGPLHVIHHDLAPEHVLVNPENGRIEGIIDWGDAMLGDVARDFVFLVTWKGWRFTEKVVGFYRRPLDDGFWERLRFMARLFSVLWLGTGAKIGADKHLTGVRHAFAK